MKPAPAKDELADRRRRVARVESKRPRAAATVTVVRAAIDPVRRRRIGAVLLKILQAPVTPEEGPPR